MDRYRLIKGLRGLIYAQVVFYGIASMIFMAFLGPLALIAIPIILMSVVFLYVLSNSENKWARTTLLVITILMWLGTIVQIISEKNLSLMTILSNLPLTAYVYLIFKE